MKTYYLVDFENVGNEGLIGCESLTSEDWIYLFYTENVKSINLNILDNHGYAKFIRYKVPVRKQSIDMHLVSFLGYLIGTNKGCDSKFVIISKDTDYDNVIKFWQVNDKIAVSRSEKIVSGKKKSNKTKKNNTLSEKTKLNNQLQKELTKAKIPVEVIGFVTSTVIKKTDENNKKNKVYCMLVSKYGQAMGLDLYNRIKKLL